ncbi:MAG TPA: response regulator [Anaeromyxobacteraceae bacterium]|nr:response regulator [Anaeromyxobacteraceae bacterium]
MRHYLIVDDNRAFAENLGEIVRDLGDEVAVAENGEQALALARDRRFDAIVTDMRMPFMGGAELVHHVRRIDPGVAAIVVTAYVRDGDLDAARREGLLATLPKPVPIGRLLELLGLARRDGLVVVVEDDAALCDNLCEALRSRGFAAVTAGSVLETERLGPVKPFCALVDLRVPGGPAGEAMKRLSAKYPGLPLLVVTGYHDEPPVPHVGVFSKPFDTASLLDAVERQYRARAAAPPAQAGP